MRIKCKSCGHLQLVKSKTPRCGVCRTYFNSKTKQNNKKIKKKRKK